MPRSPFFFDIEAGGFSGKTSSIYSISYGGTRGPVQTLGARPVPGTRVGQWAAGQVWTPLLQQFNREGKSFQTEKSILSRFIRTLEKQESGREVVGWFSGYSPTAQAAGATRVRGFDLPMLATRASQYGLGGRLQKALGRLTVRDLGQEVALNLARNISSEKWTHLVDPDLRAQAVGYMKANWEARALARHIEDPAKRLAEEARLAASIGEPVKFAGWQQGLVHELLTGKPLEQAHLSRADVEGLRRIAGRVQTGQWMQEADVRTWNRLALHNKLVSPLRFGADPAPLLEKAALAEKQYGYTGFAQSVRTGMAEKAGQYGTTLEGLLAGGRIRERTFQVTAEMTGAQIAGVRSGAVRRAANATWRGAVRNKLLVGAAGVVVGAWLIKPLSGNDDDHNTIKGLPHGGTAERLRRLSTDFGSGFQRNAVDGSFISEQVADKVITEEEFRRFLRRLRAARDQNMVLSLLDRDSARRSFNRQLRWREASNAELIKPVLTERPNLGAFGSYNSETNILNIGGYVDPRDILAEGVGKMYYPQATDEADQYIGEMTYSFLNPSRVEETILHEGLHGVWDEDIAPAHKAAFVQEAEEQLGVDSWTPWMFRGTGPDVSALTAKSPAYAQIITRAMAREEPAAIEWVANEMFAHRGALHAYEGMGYDFPRNKRLDEIVGGYVQTAGERVDLRPKFEAGFKPEDVLAEVFSPQNIARARREAGETILKGGGQQFSRERTRSLPTELMGITIPEEILSFRRDVWDVPEEKAAFQAELREKQEAAQAKLGIFTSGDLRELGLQAIEGINERDQRLKAVRLSKFDINVEDADTILLRRKGFWQGLFGQDISVRLAGVDAPETASHAGDPLGDVRIWQEQPAGQQAANVLRSMIEEEGDDLQLLISTGKKTYGRYLGALVGGEGENLNIELIRAGAVSALPFGPRREDIVAREEARAAEEVAWTHRRGMWNYSRYQAARITNKYIGRPITHNVLTRLDKLGSNLSLGAYASYLESFGEGQRELTVEEIAQSRRMGLALKRTHGPPPAPRYKSSSEVAFQSVLSGNDDDHNTIEGLGHKGIAWQIRQAMTPFGSGWDVVRKLAKTGETFEQMVASKGFQEALVGAKQVGKIGEGTFGEVHRMRGIFGGEEFEFARKTGEVEFITAKEVGITKQLSSETGFTPSFYGERLTEKGTVRQLDIELFEGRAFEKLEPSEMLKHQESAIESIRSLHGAGIEHFDPHTANAMLVGTSSGKYEVGIIDFGNAQRFSEMGIEAQSIFGKRDIAYFSTMLEAEAAGVPARVVTKQAQKAADVFAEAAGLSVRKPAPALFGGRGAPLPPPARLGPPPLAPALTKQRAKQAERAWADQHVSRQKKKLHIAELNRLASKELSANGLRAGRRSKQTFVASRSAVPPPLPKISFNRYPKRK